MYELKEVIAIFNQNIYKQEEEEREQEEEQNCSFVLKILYLDVEK